MSDQNFHEIQLSGKQLVFLFISAVAVAVVIFLLGVSVGRGVRGVALAGAGVDTGAPSDTVVSTNPPPATQPGPGELSYHNALQGTGRSGASTPPPTPPAEPVTPPPAAPPPAATQPQTTPPQTQPQQTAPASKTPSQPAPAPASPPQKPSGAVADKPDPPQKGPKAAASGAWVVQVMALRSKEGADRLISELKNKGYPAFVVNPAGGLYRVRVGPFAKRAEAEQIAGRLAKEGYQSPAVQAR